MRLTFEMQAEIATAMARAKANRDSGDADGAWRALVRAHVISQPALLPHLSVHMAMLSLAIAQRDWKETVGQVLRLILAPLGHILGRTPWGNPGRATVSKFARAPLPADVARLYAQAGIEVK
jgi:hypothetical protein